MLTQLFEQLLLPVSDPLGYLKALSERREERRDVRRMRAQAIGRFRERLLEFSAAEQMDLFANAASHEAVTAPNPTNAFFTDVAKNWTDDEITKLCDGMITQALEGLRDFKVRSNRRELFDWFAPHADAEDPFSFAFCCAVSGLDPDPIRSKIGKEFRAEILGYIAEDEAKSATQTGQCVLALA